MGRVRRCRFPLRTCGLLFLAVAVLASLPLAGQTEVDLPGAVELFRQKQYEAAKKQFEAVLDGETKSAVAAYYLGRVYFVEHDYNEAVDWLEKAAEWDRANSDYHLWLGRAYQEKLQRANFFSKLSLVGKTKRSYQTAVRLDPENLDAREQLTYFLFLAPGIAGGDKDEAWRQVAEIAKRDAVRGHVIGGKLHANQQKHTLAEKEFLAALELNPNHAEARYVLGITYQNTHEYAKAFREFETLVEQDADAPQTLNAYYQIGKTAALAGTKFDHGVECLRYFLEHNPSQGMAVFAHLQLGRIHQHRNETQEARAQYRAVLAIDPKNKAAREAIEELDKEKP